MELKEPLTDDESFHLLDLEEQLRNGSIKSKRLLRRQLRYRLFRIREGKEEYDKGLRKYMEAQFTPDMNWDTFTFNWDVAPNDPMRVVTMFEWADLGGKFETQMVLCDDGIARPQKVCYPSAFTKQE